MVMKDNLVIKANNLIEGFIDMTFNEYKLTMYLISKINREDVEFKVQRISVKEFMDLIGYDNKKAYFFVKNFAESLISRKIKIMYQNGDLVNINWFSYTKYIAEKGILEVAFNPHLSPFLLNIDIAYTKFFLSNVKFMKNKYSIRLYELLKQYQKIGKRTIMLDELKLFLGIEFTEYKQYNDFKRRVILTAQRELREYSDICFEFEEIKEGRKIVSIKFMIIANIKKSNEIIENQIESNEVQDKKEIDKNSDKDKEEIQEVMKEFKLRYNGNLDYLLTKNLIKIKGLDCVIECLKEFVNFVGNANEVEKVFYDFTKKYGTEKAYTKATTYHNTKPSQSLNYEQREYDDDYFNSLYDNVQFIK